MARCGRCGLWKRYPVDHEEKKYAGVCLWYQLRLIESDVFEPRECPDFFEAVPGLGAMDHFNYKVKRDHLGDAYQEAREARDESRFSKKLAWFGVVTSLIGITLSLWGALHG